MAYSLSAVLSRAKALLPKNRFARSVSVLAGGTAAGQAVVVLASPVLTRLYSPEDFGVLAVFGSLLAILGVIASLRYQLAIPLPESDEDAANVTVLSLIVVLGMTLITAAIAIPFRKLIADTLNTPLLADYIWLLPVGLLLAGTYQALNYWSIRVKAYSAIARTKLVQAVGMVVVQVGGYALGPLALLIGRVFGQAAGITRLGAIAITNRWELFRAVRPSGLLSSGRDYRGFPLVSTWTGLASSGGTHLPPLLIAVFLGAGAAGLYALTHRVLSVPMTVIGKAVGDVFYREAAQAHRDKELEPLVSSVHAKLSETALPVAVVIFLASPQAFVLLFGQDWEQAGQMARWMTPWLFFQFITTPPTRVYPILGRHGSAFAFQSSLLLSGLASVATGAVVFNSLMETVILLSVMNSAVYLSRLMLTYRLVGASMSILCQNLMASIPMAGLAGLPLLVYGMKYEPDNEQSLWMWGLVLSLSLGLSIMPSVRALSSKNTVVAE